MSFLSYILFRLFNRSFYLPLSYYNFYDISYGSQYPSYKIFYMNVFNGKEKVKSKCSGYFLSEKDFLFKQKIAAQKLVKHQRFLMPVVQDELLKILNKR